MKNYNKPIIEIIMLDSEDIIRTSGPTNDVTYDPNAGDFWNIDTFDK